MTRNNGFTLIELIVVVAILAILAAIGIPYYKEYSVKAKINASLANHQNYFNLLNTRATTCQSGINLNIPTKNYPGNVNCRPGRGYIGDSIAYKTLKEAEEKAKNPYNNLPASSNTYWGNGRDPANPALGYTAFGYKYSSACRPGGISGQMMVIVTNVGNVNGSSNIIRNEICTERI